MKYTIFDIETDGLLHEVTLVRCLSYRIFDNGRLIDSGSLFRKDEIISFITQQECLIGHNIICYDLPVLEKLCNISFEGIQIWDTLALSYSLYPLRKLHGLESWGEDFGVPKPVIKDWKNLTLQEYIHRCEEDVKINDLLFQKIYGYLDKIYDNDFNKILRYNNYLGFKMDCVKEQAEVLCKVDISKIESNLIDLYKLQKEKIDILVEAMPEDVKFTIKKRPKTMVKKDGSPSAASIKWFNLLESIGESNKLIEEVIVEKSRNPGNPNSSIQLKNWLFSLGWEPCTFEERKNVKGEIKEVPQIYKDSEVCDSIKDLFEIEPKLEALDMLSLVNHRIGVFNSFKDNLINGEFVEAGMRGFTNTLRLKHRKPIANLPSIYKFYGKEIRGLVITPDDNHILCGSDMSSLEDTTKQHYMYYFDPEYVKEMRVPGFDPHLDIAVLAGMMSPEESAEFKRLKGLDFKDLTEVEKTTYNRLNKIRTAAKVVNFAGVYGAGPPKLAKTLKKNISFARNLHKTYWDRNKAVKQVADSLLVKIFFKNGTFDTWNTKTLNNLPFDEQKEFFKKVDQMWLFNPVSEFWYSLRYPKDIFSTLNQGTGVYCFDRNLSEIRRRGIKIMLQYHDEHLAPVLKTQTEEHTLKLNSAIQAVNDQIKLNVPLGISMDYGYSYAECH